jgi:hypothetical protein
VGGGAGRGPGLPPPPPPPMPPSSTPGCGGAAYRVDSASVPAARVPPPALTQTSTLSTHLRACAHAHRRFTSNSAGALGGAAYLEAVDAALVRGTSFESHVAGQRGGALFGLNSGTLGVSESR